MKCPICNAEPRDRFRTRFVVALKCSSCGHIYAENPKPTQGVQRLPNPDDMLETFRRRDHRLIAFFQAKNFLQEPAILLDVGAGSGHILRPLHEEMPDVQIHCVETDPEATRYLRSRGFRVYSGLGEAGQNRYSAILLVEVLEHINEPVDFLKECKSLLTARGKIFISTPCGEVRFGYRALSTYDTPEHVQFWTQNSFRLCCSLAGLVFRQVDPRIMYLPINPPSQFVRDGARTLRDAILGRSYLVGFLSAKE
jgi:SAM-dependent methyltransferase